MSPTKKVLISIGGAVLGHLLLFGLVMVFLLVSALIGPPKFAAPQMDQSAEPKEITISFAELVEKMELLPPEPEVEEPKPEEAAMDEPKPETPEEEEEAKKVPGYLRTFADQESPDAPKNAAFESDRNTSAGTEVPSDPNDPKALKNMPSIDGRDDIPTSSMRDRKFIDGEFLDKESGGANSAAAMGNPAQIVTMMQPQKQTPDPFKEQNKPADFTKSEQSESDAKETDPDSPPDTKKSDLPDGPKVEGEKRPEQKESGQPEGMASEELKSAAELASRPVDAPEKAQPENPADAEEIPTTPGEEAAQPKATEFAADARMDQSEESFVVANSMKAPVISDAIAPEDQTAIAERPEEKIGSPSAPETAMPAASALPSAATAPLPPPAASVAAQSPAMPMVQPNAPQPMSVATQPVNPTAVQNETPSFLEEMIKSRMRGTLSNEKANAAVDAEKTPLGIYKRSVTDAIARKWHRYRLAKADWVEWGSMKISFRVDPNGKVRDLKLIENKANSVMADFSLKAILDAEIPKMPPGIVEILGSRGLSMDYDIYIN